MRRGALQVGFVVALLAGCIELQESTGGPLARNDLFPEPPPLPTRPRAGHEADGGDITIEWGDATSPRHDAFRRALDEGGELDAWVASLNARFALPHDVVVAHAECGEANAFYAPEEDTVVLCWELFDVVARVMAHPSLSEEQYAHAVGSAWLFVFIHELGHALVDAYELPITGREEDAVDDLATLILIDAGASEAAIDAAAFWILTDERGYSESQFADDHSLHPQRFYAVLCTLYGSDPMEHAWLIEEGFLPPERDARCEREYERKDRSWRTLLDPWVMAE